MSGPIKVGDLAVQVTACCESELRRAGRAGQPFQVTLIYPGHGQCPFCGFGGQLLFAEPKCIYIGWLKRIPPLEELEGEKRDEEITA